MPRISPVRSIVIRRSFCDQATSSRLRRIARTRFSPQMSFAGSKDRVLNGIAISAVQPLGSTCARPSQMPSQSMLNDMPPNSRPSRCTLFGFR